MKKTVFAATAAMLALASCSSDEMTLSTGETCQVTLTAALPAEISGRAFADGMQEKTLHYAVYLAGESEAIYATDVESTNAPEAVAVDAKNFTLTLNLVKGKSYDFIFWADSKDNEYYTFSSTDKNITVNYSDGVSNADDRDAFFQTVKSLNVSGPINQTVNLRRPFAQLNVGTSDLSYAEATGLTVTEVATSVSGVRDNLNLYTGLASGSVDVTYTAAIPEGETFPVEGYDYLSMNYLLTGEELTSATNVQNAKQELMDAKIDITLSDNSTIEVEVPNLPVQRNYRTNVYGALITSPVNFKITVNPNFNYGDKNVEVWDGSATTPTPDNNGNYTISSPSEFAGLVALLESGESLEGKTVSLKNDLYLDGQPWTSIGRSKAKGFNGTFDGKGYTIHDLSAPVFGYLNGGTVKDVTLEVVKGNAGVANNCYGDNTITGVTVNGAITGFGAGGLVYRVYEGSLNVDNCTNNADVTDTGYCAGGMVARTAVPVTITNSVNNGNITSNRYSEGKAAGFIGMPSNEPVTIDNCVNKGIITVKTTKQGAAAGFVGWTNAGVNISNSVNEGDVFFNLSKSASTSVVGGIYGGSGWDNGAKVINKCENKGNITVTVDGINLTANSEAYQYGVYVGGVMGFACYNDVTVTDCTVSGKVSVTTTDADNKPQSQYVSALIGAIGWEKNVTVTGNTLAADLTMTANQGQYAHVTPYFFAVEKTGTVITLDNNTNNTTYTQD